MPPIEGENDRPRTPEHTFLQQTLAEEMQASGYYQRVGRNLPLSKFSGREHKPDIRPDNIGLTHEGKIDMIEIKSPGQTLGRIKRKLEKALNQLPPKMRGQIHIVVPEEVIQ
jgi:hypothetical protein